MNDFAFGNETKNCVLTRHHKSPNILCAEPVCRPLDAGFRSYCRDVGALPPLNAFDGHSFLPSCGLERFPAKWIPVRVKKTRQINNLELRSDSIGTEKALGPTPAHSRGDRRAISIQNKY